MPIDSPTPFLNQPPRQPLEKSPEPQKRRKFAAGELRPGMPPFSREVSIDGQKCVTPWFPPGVNPVREGEYNASMFQDPNWFRWYSLESGWSELYSSHTSESYVALARKTPASRDEQVRMWWRGISYDPNLSIPISTTPPKAENG